MRKCFLHDLLLLLLLLLFARFKLLKSIDLWAITIQPTKRKKSFPTFRLKAAIAKATSLVAAAKNNNIGARSPYKTQELIRAFSSLQTQTVESWATTSCLPFHLVREIGVFKTSQIVNLLTIGLAVLFQTLKKINLAAVKVVKSQTPNGIKNRPNLTSPTKTMNS